MNHIISLDNVAGDPVSYFFVFPGSIGQPEGTFFFFFNQARRPFEGFGGGGIIR